MSRKEKNKFDNLSPLGREYLKYLGELKAYLKSFFSSEYDIEDVLQELYIRATAAEKSGEIKTPRAFLYKVTKNLAINHKSLAYNRLVKVVEDYSELNAVSTTPTLEDQVGHEKHFAKFCDAVLALPPKCRKAFVMQKVYGLSHREIADLLNISVSTVEKHLIKGLLLCESYLARSGYFVGDLDISSKSKKPTKYTLE